MNTRSGFSTALAALVIGAFFAGASTLFVRLSELGPIASAFHRAFLALPALWLLAFIDSRNGDRDGRRLTGIPLPRGRDLKVLALAGAFFAGDLFFWHLAIVNTTVANATLLATMAPIYVTIGMFVLFGERPTLLFVVGMVLAIVGAGFLIGGSLTLNPERLVGDIYGVVTGLFFASYIVAISRLRARLTASAVMYWSTLVTAAILLPVALFWEGELLAVTLYGWTILFTLALVSHVGGQGLIAYALAHLPAAFSSVTMLLEVVSAAFLGWVFLAEPLGLWQWVGAAIIVSGIFVANRGRG